MVAKATNDLGALLRRVDGLLTDWDPARRRALGKPATAAALRVLGDRPPVELTTWFGWHDGQKGARALTPMDNTTLVSLRDAARIARELEADPEVEGWRASWLPLLENGAGDYLCFERSGRSRGALVMYRHDDPGRPRAYRSLAAWAQAAIVALEEAASPIDASAPPGWERVEPPRSVARLPAGTQLAYRSTSQWLGPKPVWRVLEKLDRDTWLHADHAELEVAIAHARANPGLAWPDVGALHHVAPAEVERDAPAPHVGLYRRLREPEPSRGGAVRARARR